jgi:hypothetical protein
MFQEDIENVKSFIYKNLKPLNRKSEKRHIRVQISKCFFLHLRNNFMINGRFKDATQLIESFSIPTVYEIDTERSSGMRLFQVRLSNGKMNGQFSSKPWITLRFIRCNIFHL